MDPSFAQMGSWSCSLSCLFSFLDILPRKPVLLFSIACPSNLNIWLASGIPSLHTLFCEVAVGAVLLAYFAQFYCIMLCFFSFLSFLFPCIFETISHYVAHGWPETHIEIHLPLSPRCWIKGMRLMPGHLLLFFLLAYKTFLDCLHTRLWSFNPLCYFSLQIVHLLSEFSFIPFSWILDVPNLSSSSLLLASWLCWTKICVHRSECYPTEIPSLHCLFSVLSFKKSNGASNGGIWGIRKVMENSFIGKLPVKKGQLVV